MNNSFLEMLSLEIITVLMRNCLSLISANIPWTNLKNPIFRNFLENYKSIPNESTPRKNYLGLFYSVGTQLVTWTWVQILYYEIHALNRII